MTLLEVSNMTLSYNTKKTVISDLTFSVRQGEIVCILGPSGGGKTTLLRAIAGLERIENGFIAIDEKQVSQKKSHVLPEDRGISMVFQDDALFPHLNVFDNIAFGIRTHSLEDRKKRVANLAALLRVEDLLYRHPHQLSGGQRQRVSLARALAPMPKLLLLDEPMSNVDIELREKVGEELRAVFLQEKITVVLVSHSQLEAFYLADQIGVIHDGRLEQWGSPYDLYRMPKTRFVANFIGEGSFLSGHIAKHNAIATEIGLLHGNVVPTFPVGTKLQLLLRPDDLLVDHAGSFFGTITAKKFRGTHFLYELCLPSGCTILGSLPGLRYMPVNSLVRFRIKPHPLVGFVDEKMFLLHQNFMTSMQDHHHSKAL